MKDKLLCTIKESLLQIGKQIGFLDYHSKSGHAYDKLFISGDHALSIEIDWHDFNLEAYVIHRINGDLNTANHTVLGRMYKIPLWYIYEVDPPRVNSYTPEEVMRCFEFYVSLIENHLDVLQDFIVHINENTSVECTNTFYRVVLMHRISENKQEYLAGKLNHEMYIFLCESLISQYEAQFGITCNIDLLNLD